MVDEETALLPPPDSRLTWSGSGVATAESGGAGRLARLPSFESGSAPGCCNECRRLGSMLGVSAPTCDRERPLPKEDAERLLLGT